MDRFILILAWYLASWHIAPKAVKKPLNPVLGKLSTVIGIIFKVIILPIIFPNRCLIILLNQHISIWYQIQRLRLMGFLFLNPDFWNSSAAMMEGWAHLTLGEHNGEIYEMNQPNVYCRGILFGKMKMELGDHMFVKCEKTGIEADIEFKTKGFISGTYDAIDGYIKDSKTSENRYHITGKWNEVMEIKDLKTGKKRVLVDTKNHSGKAESEIIRRARGIRIKKALETNC